MRPIALNVACPQCGWRLFGRFECEQMTLGQGLGASMLEMECIQCGKLWCVNIMLVITQHPCTGAK